MTADGGHSTGTGVASPGHPEQADQAAGRARPASRFWWVLPYCAGALAVLVVAGLVIGLRYNAAPPKPKPTAAASAAPAAPKPAEVFPDTLFSQLTKDLQAGNETAFLSLASPAAQPAIRTWWANLKAIGFTTGAVLPTADVDGVHIDSHGDGSTVVLAGAHSPLDPLDLDNKPYIPMAHYRIGLHFSGPGATGQITSWQPLDDTPWDGGPLYVRKAAYVTVAGPAADSALVNQILPVAETAAAYDIKMDKNIVGSVQQQGFVLFVGASAAAEKGWFATDPQPDGWPPEFLGARAVQLPGPAVTEDYSVGSGQSTLVNAISDNSMGGIRVVLAPTEPATGTVLHAEGLTLVRTFMLDILGASDEELAYHRPLHFVPSWTEEGIAVAVEALFEGNPNPTPKKYTFVALTTELRRLPKSYRSGVYPTTADLFGPSLAKDEDWGYVAASAYEYINDSYNLPRMLVAAQALYFAQPTPFGNIFKTFATNPKDDTFYGIHSIRLGWQPWLAHL